MFLSEGAECLINELRDSGVCSYKAYICDAMSIIMYMYQTHASEKEKEMLANAIDALSNYNQLITALSKEK